MLCYVMLLIAYLLNGSGADGDVNGVGVFGKMDSIQFLEIHFEIYYQLFALILMYLSAI